MLHDVAILFMLFQSLQEVWIRWCNIQKVWFLSWIDGDLLSQFHYAYYVLFEFRRMQYTLAAVFGLALISFSH